MRYLYALLLMTVMPPAQSNADVSNAAATPCDSVSDFLAVGDRVLTEISAWPDDTIPVGSQIHSDLARLQDTGVQAMGETWQAEWKTVRSWFPTLTYVHNYLTKEFSREMAVKVLGLFVTAHPENYMRTLYEMKNEDRWMPGEFLAVCMTN